MRPRGRTENVVALYLSFVHSTSRHKSARKRERVKSQRGRTKRPLLVASADALADQHAPSPCHGAARSSKVSRKQLETPDCPLVGDVHIGLGECVFVFPLCGFFLSLFCNYISGLYMGVLASCIVGVYEGPGVIQAWHLSFSIHAMPTECAISVGTEDRCMQYS